MGVRREGKGALMSARKVRLWTAHGTQPSYAFATLLGSIILGPIHKELTSPPRQDQSLGQLYDVLADPPRVTGLSPVQSGKHTLPIAELALACSRLFPVVWVHAYVVADLFVSSLTSSKAIDKRLLAVAGRMSWAGDAEILRKEFPDRPYPPVQADAPTMNYPGADVIEFL